MGLGVGWGVGGGFFSLCSKSESVLCYAFDNQARSVEVSFFQEGFLRLSSMLFLTLC